MAPRPSANLLAVAADRSDEVALGIWNEDAGTRIPFRGDLLLLQAVLVLFTATGTAIGLAISSIARPRQQGMLGVFVIASPMIVLSGYAAPVENMPRAVEIISRADPVRYMLVASRGLFLQDMPFAVVLQQAWPMAIIALVTLAVAGVAVRRAVA